jgi:hypothetical protein
LDGIGRLDPQGPGERGAIWLASIYAARGGGQGERIALLDARDAALTPTIELALDAVAFLGLGGSERATAAYSAVRQATLPGSPVVSD